MPNIPKHLLALAHAAAAPAELQERSCEEIKPGQIWRARWEGISVAVLVVGALSEENRELCVPVVPITIEPHGENEQSLVIDSFANMFGIEVALWLGLKKEIPLRTLDICFGEMPNQITAYCELVSRDESAEVPYGARIGRPITSVFADDAEIEATLEDELAELAQAKGLVVEDSGPTRLHLREQIAHIDLDDVMAELNITQAVAMQVLRGHARLTVGQIQILARLANMNPEDVSQLFQGLPGAVILAVEHPRWRRELDRLAAHSGRKVYEVREEAAHEILAMAARQTRSSHSYDDRLARWIERHRPSSTSDQA